jgi:hypothetical protein
MSSRLVRHLGDQCHMFKVCARNLFSVIGHSNLLHPVRRWKFFKNCWRFIVHSVLERDLCFFPGRQPVHLLSDRQSPLYHWRNRLGGLRGLRGRHLRGRSRQIDLHRVLRRAVCKCLGSRGLRFVRRGHFLGGACVRSVHGLRVGHDLGCQPKVMLAMRCGTLHANRLHLHSVRQGKIFRRKWLQQLR